MVIASSTEVIIEVIDTGDATSTGRVLRIMRVMRVTRTLRLGRLLRYAHAFKQITYSLQASMGTLFWALLLIFLVVYCFAIAFTQAVTEHLLHRDVADTGIDSDYAAQLRISFKTVPE